MESSPRDRRPISFAPRTPAFNRRSATNHACVIVLRGLKPTATVKCRSATGGVPEEGVGRSNFKNGRGSTKMNGVAFTGQF